MHGVDRSARLRGVDLEIGRGDAIAFDGRHPGAARDRRGDGKQPDARIEIDDVAAERNLPDDVRDE